VLKRDVKLQLTNFIFGVGCRARRGIAKPEVAVKLHKTPRNTELYMRRNTEK